MTQSQQHKKLWLSTDGGARGNPGPAALGFVLKDEQGHVVMEHGQYLGETTNNVAEYSALIEGLKAAAVLGAVEIDIAMDSELIVKQMSGEYKIKQPHLQELAVQVKRLLTDFDKYEFKHVLRAYNKDADRMVNHAIDKALGIK
ncbi:ribonuclease HI family protein [bacterium]|nr:MAG: ribonuclease HI family protein [bacterium]